MKERFCWVCGASMGEIEDRNFSKRDTCGLITCEREARDGEREDREQAHRDLDEREGWS